MNEPIWAQHSARRPTTGREFREIRGLNGRVLRATPVLDTYWDFACKRQDVFMRRVANVPPPWTDDQILASFRFTNPYRASDRVSQYLIRHVIYEGDDADDEVFFRVLLFKMFNKIETWEGFRKAFGQPSWRDFKLASYSAVLDERIESGEAVYSGAYIMPSPRLGHGRKHSNHLELLQLMMSDGAPRKVRKAKSLAEVFEILRSYPSIGDFLAFQYAIDLNYSELIDFSEMDFVVAGPGARDGIAKCFCDSSMLQPEEVVRFVSEVAEDEFRRLGLKFQSLWGRPLQLIDYQNLFCEVSKYTRVSAPWAKGTLARSRIKQRYSPKSDPLPQWYPPKWNVPVRAPKPGAE